MKICKQLALLVLCTAGINAAASANLAFTGTLVEPPLCTINNGNTLTIDFKDVGVNKVDGINYRLPMNYTITCAGSTLPWEMVLTVKGRLARLNLLRCRAASPTWGLSFCKMANLFSSIPPSLSIRRHLLH